MPIHLAQNQYRGVNAHLHSYFQQDEGWIGFHSDHITHLREAVQRALPRNSGYFALTEQSLQLAYYDPEIDKTVINRHRPDVTIYHVGAEVGISPASTPAAPTAILPLEATIAEPEELSSVVIVREDETGTLTPVTRIELLSPANKPPGSNYQKYLDKCDETLLRGTRLVEIDYLHEQHSPVAAIPDYTRRVSGAYPYMILVNDPAPGRRQVQVYGFRVDDLIPAVSVPLMANDAVVLDFGSVYQHTFNANDFYGLIRVDYDQAPLNFGSYDTEDQQRIHQVMARAKEAAAL